jgi:hypothetical protein
MALAALLCDMIDMVVDGHIHISASIGPNSS